MKYILIFSLFFCGSCTFVKGIFQQELVLQAQVVGIDSLTFTPEQIRTQQPLEVAKGVTLTPISHNQALLTQPAQKKGKTKYKNVGNDYSKDKSKVKDTGNITAKKEGIIGDNNSPIAAKRSVVGEGNIVTPAKRLPGWVAWVAAVLALFLVFWPTVWKIIKKIVL